MKKAMMRWGELVKFRLGSWPAGGPSQAEPNRVDRERVVAKKMIYQ